MELLQLTYFCDAAITQNFSKTAEKYSVPPSNISQSIKRLENELSVALFDRNANRVVLNKQGHIFYEKAQQALELLEDAKASVTGTERSCQLQLAVLVNRRIVMKTIKSFQNRCPNVNILTSFDLSGMQDAHLVISADKIDFPGFTREKLLQEDIVLAVSKGTLPDGPITALSLQSKNFITMDEGSSLYRFTESICEDMGFRPHIALKSADPFYIRRCVELGLGVAFVPTFSWHDQFSDEVELKHIGHYKRDVFLYRRARHFNADYIDEFCVTLKEEIQKENGLPIK